MAERRSLRAEILTLSKQRDEFVAAGTKTGAGDQMGFDAAVAGSTQEAVAVKEDSTLRRAVMARSW
ncbi:MAG: hypothetical protein WKF84_02355 [Pyrinomonadaceae bacterium]